LASGDDGAPAGRVEAVVGRDDDGIRLDRWLRRHHPELTHALVEKWLRQGLIRVEGGRARAADRVQQGQAVSLPRVPAAGRAPRRAAAPPLAEHEARALRRRILHIDEVLIAIDKPAGLAVQGGSKVHHHLDGMLDALRCGGERPRLVHRLDRDTSGVLLLARNATAAAHLARAFRERALAKVYWALVVGVPAESRGEIRLALAKVAGPGGERMAVDSEGGEPATTRWHVVERVGRQAAWLALEPLTGRTHQLRAHCAALGTPILGDAKYGQAAPPADLGVPASALHLHARSITLPHPHGGTLTITAPLPPHMAATWRFFGFPGDDGSPAAGLARPVTDAGGLSDRRARSRMETAPRRPRRG
jgi:23S rRNA pseudouridine955/2504/2580 synthase